MNSKLPNLLVIGAMKAGTTSFHEMLNQHPDIFMSEEKEIDFFIDDRNYALGIDWYKQHFVHGAHCTYRGESSTSYTKMYRFPGVAEKIKETLAKSPKFIYLLRDPVKRFQSNFTDSKTYGDIPSKCNINTYVSERSLDKNPLIQTSRYYYQIESYLKLFGKKNVLIIEFEELINSPDSVFETVYSFLDVKKMHLEKVKKNVSMEKTYYNENAIALRDYVFLRNIVPIGFKEKLKRTVLFSRIFKSKVNSKLNILDGTSIRLLKSYFLKDISQLISQTDFSPKNWGNNKTGA